MPDDAGTATGTVTEGGGDSTTDPNATANTTTGNAADNATTDNGTSAGGEKDWAAEAEKWKGLARKHEQRAKENSSAASKLQAIEDGQKSELQKAQERADAAERDRNEERSERFRLLAAAQQGLGPEFIAYLGGGEESEISDRAETLNKSMQAEVEKRVDAELTKYGIVRSGQNGQAPTASAAASLGLGRRPVESLRAGSAPAQTTPNNPNDLFRGMMHRG